MARSQLNLRLPENAQVLAVKLHFGNDLNLAKVKEQSLSNLASVLFRRGELVEVEAMFREALEIRAKLDGEATSEHAKDPNDLGLVLQARGDLAGAEAMLRRSMAVYQELYGEVHSGIADSLGNLATLLRDRGDLAGAEAMSRECLTMRKIIFPDPHPAVADVLFNLATLVADRVDLAEDNLTLDAEAFAVLAMALHQLKYASEARTALLKGVEISLRGVTPLVIIGITRNNPLVGFGGRRCQGRPPSGYYPTVSGPTVSEQTKTVQRILQVFPP